MKFYVPIQPVNSDKDCMNNLCVSIDHDKRRKAIYAAVYPCEVKADGIVIIEITAGKYSELEPMARLNRNRLTEAIVNAKREVDSKNGKVWEFVSNFAREKGFSIL